MKKIALFMVLFIFIASLVLPVTAIDLKSAQQQKSNVDSRISKVKSDKQKAQEEKAKLESAQKNIAAIQAEESKEI